MKTLGIILGSTRQHRFGDKVAQWLCVEGQQLTDVQAKLLDLKEFALPFFDEPKPPSALGGVYSSPEATRWAEAIKSCDALVFCTPEYNHSYPAVLKNAIDYLYAEWHGKPYTIVSYSGGPIGGARCATRLRGLLDYMGLRCHGEVNIPFVTKVIDTHGQLVDRAWSERMQTSLKKLIA
jgi:NAD(P)H-dependent FMN reductase